MAELAIAILIAYAVLAFFVRVAIHVHDTGTTGLLGLREGAGPVEVLAGAMFLGGMVMGVLSPVLVLTGGLEPIDALDIGALHVIGTILASVGVLAVFLAQLGMGESWRIGVSDDERTGLVTGGWFAFCRNPIYTSMIAAWTGFALMVPTWLGIAALAVVTVGLELQVRAVEEPHLVRTHGEEYRAYTSRVGRFVPGVGRTS